MYLMLWFFCSKNFQKNAWIYIVNNSNLTQFYVFFFEIVNSSKTENASPKIWDWFITQWTPIKYINQINFALLNSTLRILNELVGIIQVRQKTKKKQKKNYYKTVMKIIIGDILLILNILLCIYLKKRNLLVLCSIQ